MLSLQKYVLQSRLLIALLLGACAPLGMKPSPEPVVVKALLLPYLSFAPFFIAEEEGYFAKQGLRIEFVKLVRTEEAVPALIRGDLDVGGVIVTPSLLNAIAHGARIRFVADKGYIAATGCTSNALMARRELIEDGELAGPAQLQGRRIGLVPTIYSGYYVEKLLNTAGLTLDDVESEYIPIPARSEALEKGAIDAVDSQEPWVTLLLQTGHTGIWMPAQQVIPDFQLGLVLYGSTLLDENPDAGRRFMVAYREAVQQYGQGKTERNLEILAKYTGLDRELLTQACWLPIRESGQINVQSILDFQAWTVEKGYLDNPVTEEQFWDSSFIEYANEVLGASSQ